MKDAVECLEALVIDDHPVTHLGCRSLLAELDFHKVHKAVDCGSSLRFLEKSAPHLILLDLGLPGVGGLKLLPQLIQRAPEAAILVFTMNENPAFAMMALENGAHGFLSKNAPPEHFLQAVRTVMEGRVYLEADLAMAVATRRTKKTDLLADLSPREVQILRLIGHGLTYENIAAEIHVSYKTVANVSSGLRRKLSARSLSDLIRIALEVEASSSFDQEA